MSKQLISVSFLLGASIGLVDALPRPQAGFSSFPTFSFSGFAYPTLTPTGFSIGPIGSSGFASATGTGYSGTGHSCLVSYVTATAVSSAPIATGSSVSSILIDTSSSGAAASSVSISYSVGSVPAPQSGSESSSLAAPVSASSEPVSSVPVSSAVASSEPVSSVPVSSAVASSVVSVPAASASSSPASSSSVTASSGCTFTDADTAAASKGSCSTIVLSGITVPAGETLDMTDLNDGTTVSFEGTTTFEYEEWEGPLISFSGKSITITGASGHVIDGNGAKWWDGEGSNGGVTKPKFFYAHDLTDSTISGLNIKNTPVQGISVDGAENLKIEDVTIDDSAGDTEGGHNTDCFDIGESTGVYLSGITCKNQDDCIAINSGTDISFTGGTCSGGHGLSIGSVGGRDDNTVENVYIASSSISDSMNGVRIKCNSGDTGTVKNVTYSDITLSGITDFGIVIEQDYENGSPTGTPTDGIPITDVTLEGITGSVTDDAQAYYILCAACSDWTVSGVDVTGGSQSSDCEGVPSGASSLC